MHWWKRSLALALGVLSACAAPVLPEPASRPFATKAVSGGLVQNFAYTHGMFSYGQSGLIRWYSDASNGAYTAGDGNTLSFSFTGSALRIYGSRQARGSASIPVVVDGVPYSMSCYNGGTTSPAYDQLLLDVTGLGGGSHTVTVTNPTRGKYTYFRRIEVLVPGTPIARRHLLRATPDTAAPIDQPDLDYVADRYHRYFFNRYLPGNWAGTIQPTAAYLKARNPAIELWATESLQTTTPGDFHYAAADSGTYAFSHTLASSITNTTTQIPYSDAAAVPTAPFYIQIDGERILISSVNTGTRQMQVQLAPHFGRGIRYAIPHQAAAAHAAGAAITFPREDWFLHDASAAGQGSRLVYNAGVDQGYVMDLRRPDWRNQLAATAVATVGSDARFAGLLMTKVGLLTGGSLRRMTGAPTGAPTLPTGYTTGFVANATATLSTVRTAMGKLIGASWSPNAGSPGPTIGNPNFSGVDLLVSDGLGHHAAQTDAATVSFAQWGAAKGQWDSARTSSIRVAGQGGTPNTAGQAATDRHFMRSFATYLLLMNSNAGDTFDFWASLGAGNDYHPYYEATEVPLGAPVGNAYPEPSEPNVWRRDFQNGVVLVNPTTATRTVSFGNTLFAVGNGAATAGTANIPTLPATYTAATGASLGPAAAGIYVFAAP